MTKTTLDYIHDLCCGYPERHRELELGDKGRPRRAAMLAEYMRINSAIDVALLLVESEPLRAQIKRALIEGSGYNAQYQIYCGYHQFYTWKRLVTNEIARLLHLAE